LKAASSAAYAALSGSLTAFAFCAALADMPASNWTLAVASKAFEAAPVVTASLSLLSRYVLAKARDASMS
jgi:hypothetical protein